MFGLFKPKLAAQGPIEFKLDIQTDKPIAEVWPLIDWSDGRHAKRAVGASVEEVGGNPDRFDMVLPHLDDVVF